MFLLALGLALRPALPLGAAQPEDQPVTPVVTMNQTGMAGLQAGVQLYLGQKYRDAALVLQQVVEGSQGSQVLRATAGNFLSLAYQKLDQWPQAEKALQGSFKELQGLNPDLAEVQLTRAKLLNTQGQLQLKTGQTQQALESWKQAAVAYGKANDAAGVALALINQSQALQTLGFYEKALIQLDELDRWLADQPDSLAKAIALRSYGNTLRAAGKLQQSEEKLLASLKLLQSLDAILAEPETLLSLGNTARAMQAYEKAIDYYRQSAQRAGDPSSKIQAHLNQFSLFVEAQQAEEATALASILKSEFAAVPLSRQSVFARIQFIQSLSRLRQQSPSPDLPDLPALLQFSQLTLKQAQELGDQRSESYALGNLGALYEQTQNWTQAKQLTEQALLVSQAIPAKEISYRWQWQTGRILEAMGDRQQALTIYRLAIDSLKELRSDLVSLSPDVQFSFRDSVEPIYREFVSLLLQPGEADVSQENLNQARLAMESLQLAELEDFFRQACLEGTPAQIDRVDPTAAVIYPILLKDRLEVIASLPQKPLKHYATSLPRETVEAEVRSFRTLVSRQGSDEFLPVAQDVYNWLIRPIEAALQESQIKTLVFVLDGPMRNVPMSALHTGKGFLIEQYAVALAPGLQLVDLKPLKREKLKVLAAGLSEAREGFTPLPHVQQEIDRIRTELPSTVLFNDTFTITKLRQELQAAAAPVVHLATHGEFSSRADRTFVLTWDERMNATEFTQVLQSRPSNRQSVIELLVLSACRTAVGDRRAALGLAGIAVRAGARSTMGTLWYVSDEATSSLMVNFYKLFSENASLNKAEVLRSAQLALLKNPDYQHPFFWAPYILIGNWL